MDNSEEIKNLSEAIKSNHSIDFLTSETANNLSVYQKNYILTLAQSLREKFVAVTHLLGEKNMNYFAKEYISKNPSRSSNLDDYGREFPQFLGQSQLITELFYIEALGQLDWFYFTTHESGESIELPVGILRLWDSLVHDTPIEAVEIEEYLEKIVYKRHSDGITLFPSV